MQDTRTNAGSHTSGGIRNRAEKQEVDRGRSPEASTLIPSPGGRSSGRGRGLIRDKLRFRALQAVHPRPPGQAPPVASPPA